MVPSDMMDKAIVFVVQTAIVSGSIDLFAGSLRNGKTIPKDSALVAPLHSNHICGGWTLSQKRLSPLCFDALKPNMYIHRF